MQHFHNLFEYFVKDRGQTLTVENMPNVASINNSNCLKLKQWIFKEYWYS